MVAAALWGRAWHRSQVHFVSDNQAVVAVLSTRTTRDPPLIHLLRCLFFIQAQFMFYVSAQHVAGRQNGAGNALS